MASPVYTSPPDWTVGQIVTAADMNTYVTDNLEALRKPPSVLVTNSANQSIATATETALAFNTERQKTDTGLHDNSTNNSRVTIPATGWYQLDASVEFAAASSGQRKLWIELNGASKLVAGQGVASGTVTSVISVSARRYLTVGDYVRAVVWQDSGGNVNVLKTNSYSPEFCVQWIGE